MRKKIILLLIIIFPFSGFSQVNKDAAKIKKKGIKELRLFDEENDSVPATTIYYDKEGRLTKFIFLDFYLDSPMTWEAQIIEYDNFGRVVSVRKKYSLSNDPDKMIFYPDDDQIESYTYEGDSIILYSDSVWENTRLIQTSYIRQTMYWKQTPSPDPKPIFWLDSICTSKTNILRSLYYHYDTGDSIPKYIDSTVMITHSSWSIENGKLIENGYLENDENKKNGRFKTKYEMNRVYTLNQRYDTMTWTMNVKSYWISDDNIEHFSTSANHNSSRTYKTTRIGPWHELHFIGPGKKKGKKTDAAYEETFPTYPWDDYSIYTYFESCDLYDTIDWEAKILKYESKKEKRKTIYW